MSEIISVKNLCLNFANEKIIENLSFHVNSGEKIAIIGASGKGKSTVLNVLLGFITDFKGEVKMFDKKLNEKNIGYIRKQTAWLPQELIMNFETAGDLLLLPFEFTANTKQKPDKNKIQNILNEFNLSEKLLNKKSYEISGGQKQRILLASCLLMNKSILFLDEPTSALDENSKKKVCDFIISRKNLTVIASTHDKYWINKSDKIIEL